MRTALVAVVFLVLIGALGYVADAVLTDNAEEQAAARISSELGAPATVELRGWPVALRLLTGTVPEATVHAVDVPLPGRPGRLSRLDVALTDVAVELYDVGGEDIPVRAGTGDFTAELDAASLLELAGSPPGLDRIDLVDGVIRLTVLGALTVDAVPTVVEGAVVLTPTAPVLQQAEVRIPLGDLPAGAVVEDVRVADGSLVLTGTVRDLLLPTAAPTPQPATPQPVTPPAAQG